MTTLLTQNASESTIMCVQILCVFVSRGVYSFLEGWHEFVCRPNLVCEYVRTYFSVCYMQSQTRYRHRLQPSRERHELIDGSE